MHHSCRSSIGTHSTGEEEILSIPIPLFFLCPYMIVRYLIKVWDLRCLVYLWYEPINYLTSISCRTHGPASPVYIRVSHVWLAGLCHLHTWIFYFMGPHCPQSSCVQLMGLWYPLPWWASHLLQSHVWLMGLHHLQHTPIFYFMGPCFSVILHTTYGPAAPFMLSLTSVSCTTHGSALLLYTFLFIYSVGSCCPQLSCVQLMGPYCPCTMNTSDRLMMPL